jgi:hypothetical protein
MNAARRGLNRIVEGGPFLARLLAEQSLGNRLCIVAGFVGRGAKVVAPCIFEVNLPISNAKPALRYRARGSLVRRAELRHDPLPLHRFETSHDEGAGDDPVRAGAHHLPPALLLNTRPQVEGRRQG